RDLGTPAGAQVARAPSFSSALARATPFPPLSRRGSARARHTSGCSSRASPLLLERSGPSHPLPAALTPRVRASSAHQRVPRSREPPPSRALWTEPPPSRRSHAEGPREFGTSAGAQIA